MKQHWRHFKVLNHLINKLTKKKAKASKNLSRIRGQQVNHYLVRVLLRQNWFLSRNVLASHQASALATSRTSYLRIKRQAKAKDTSNPDTAPCNDRAPIRNGKKFTIRLTFQVSLEIVAPLLDNLSDKMREILLPHPTPSTTLKSNRSIQTKIISRNEIWSKRVTLNSRSHPWR